MTATLDRAVVLGGSMAGLLAARVLSAHAREVVVLERDALPERAAHRKGVPQSRHSHVLLGAGRRVLDRLFPGLTQTLIERGAEEGDPLREGRRYIGGGYHAQRESTLRTLLASRPMLEAEVRARLRGIANVRIRDGVDIRNLAASGDRVTGVHLEQDGTPETLEADLVVDATGRGSRAPQWLQAMGFGMPVEESVPCGVSYATRHFRHVPGQVGGLKMVICAPGPGHLRGGVLMRQEDGRWVMTVIGMKGEKPAAEPESFTAFARSLPASEFGEIAALAEPLDEPVPAHFPGNVRRRYDLLERFPRGLVVIGDAVCSFNPMYGQGMTVAALEVTSLEAALAEGGPDDLGPRFFRHSAGHLSTPWLLAAGNDHRLTQPDARVSRPVRAVRWYMDRLHVAARRDPDVALAFLRVTGLVDPLKLLFRPAVAMRVLAGG